MNPHSSNRFLLEICVTSLDYAIAAQRAGADRIELCSDLDCGGVTPSTRLMETARGQLRIPIHVLIRPRAGDFVYSAREFRTMREAIQTAKDLKMDGIVVGILDRNSRIDVARTRQLVELAHPLPVTFHRAFDETHSGVPRGGHSDGGRPPAYFRLPSESSRWALHAYSTAEGS